MLYKIHWSILYFQCISYRCMILHYHALVIWKSIGSMSYIDLPNVDTFPFTIFCFSHILLLWPTSSEKSVRYLSMLMCQLFTHHCFFTISANVKTAKGKQHLSFFMKIILTLWTPKTKGLWGHPRVCEPHFGKHCSKEGDYQVI